MKAVRCLTVSILTAGLATAALAAEPQRSPQAPAAPITNSQSATIARDAAAPAAGLADIPENQAEQKAVEQGLLELTTPDAAAPAPVEDAVRVARRAAFAAVLAEQEARVAALAERLTAADGQAALDLQRQIESEKLGAGRRLLELQLQFATSDGDQARSERLRAAIADWDAPKPVGTPIERPVPANPNR